MQIIIKYQDKFRITNIPSDYTSLICKTWWLKSTFGLKKEPSSAVIFKPTRTVMMKGEKEYPLWDSQ